MQIKSPLFEHGEQVPEKNTCLGQNINPHLKFEDVPEAANSLVLIFEDVNASPKQWTHWLLFNISPNVKEIMEGAVPEHAVEALANNHSFGYEGPCPKYFTGTHHYWFRLYALDTMLYAPAATEREEIEELMKDHIIEKAELSCICVAPA